MKVMSKKQRNARKSSEEVFLPSKEEIAEAARILKSGGSKKRERRKAAGVMSVIGSKKGGENRARNLSPEQRREIAIMGGLARQAKARESAKMRVDTTSRATTLQ